MPNIEYKSREQVAFESTDPEGYLSVNLSTVILAVGDRALFDDLVLTPDARASKQHGPRSAIYSAVNLSNAIVLGAARFQPSDLAAEDVLADRIRIAEAVEEAASRHQIYERPAFDLMHSIAVSGLFYGRRDSMPTSSVEVRQTPEGGHYVALAVPSYLRATPMLVSKYIQAMKQEGKPFDPALEDIAYQNDNRKVARNLAVNAMYHIQKEMEDYDDLESQFAEE